ncbi:Fic family protein [Streptomyces sp. NPDC054854]
MNFALLAGWQRLRETTDPDIPPAARAYLGVAFFHPFTDGNARAALLTLVHVLAREDIVLSEVGPLQTTPLRG